MLDGLAVTPAATDVQAGGLAFGTGTTFTAGAAAVTMEERRHADDIHHRDRAEPRLDFGDDKPRRRLRRPIQHRDDFRRPVERLTNGNKVLVSVASGTNTACVVPLINYSSEGANVPHFVRRIDGSGTGDLTVTDAGGVVALTATDQSGQRGLTGNGGFSGDPNWSNGGSWYEGTS